MKIIREGDMNHYDKKQAEKLRQMISAGESFLSQHRSSIMSQIRQSVQDHTREFGQMYGVARVKIGKFETYSDMQLSNNSDYTSPTYHSNDLIRLTVDRWLAAEEPNYAVRTEVSYEDDGKNKTAVIRAFFSEKLNPEPTSVAYVYTAEELAEEQERQAQQAEYDAYYNRIVQILGYENRVDYFMGSMGLPVAVQLMNKVEEGSLEMHEARWLLQQDQNGLHASRNADILPFDHIDRVVCRQGRIDLIDIFATDDATANTIITDRETRGLLNASEASYLRQRYATSFYVEEVSVDAPQAIEPSPVMPHSSMPQPASQPYPDEDYNTEPLTYPSGTNEHFTTEQLEWTSLDDAGVPPELTDRIESLGYIPTADEMEELLDEFEDMYLPQDPNVAFGPGTDGIVENALYWDAMNVYHHHALKRYRHAQDHLVEMLLDSTRPLEYEPDAPTLR